MTMTESQAVLTRLLSAKSTFSTPAQEAVQSECREIGKGSCGYIFTEPSSPHRVIKRAVSPAYNEALCNDYNVHMRLVDAFDKYAKLPGWNLPKLPNRYGFTPAAFLSKTKKDGHGEPHLWPEEYKVTQPINLLYTERIYPLPKSARDALIDIYCPTAGRAQARAMPANEDCLLRLYLGMRRDPRPSMFFALRNFPLYVNRAQEYGVDVEAYAVQMGSALEVMHWELGINARDVEFVLGTAREDHGCRTLGMGETNVGFNTEEPPSGEVQNHICLWLLDLDKCHSIALDEGGVSAAVKALLQNDRYFPMPLTENHDDERLWQVFKDAYLERSSAVIQQKPNLDESSRRLPELFVTRLVEERGLQLKKRVGSGPSVR